MTALPNAKSTLSIAIDTVTSRPYAEAAATTQETVCRVSSSKLSSIDDDGELLVSSCSGRFSKKLYPLGDCSRSQFFVDEGVASGEVDEGESECLASSCLGWAHGALLVPIAARRWAPRLLANGGMIPHSSSTRRDTLTSSDSIESNSCPCRAGPRSLSHAIGGVCERILIIFLLPIPRK